MRIHHNCLSSSVLTAQAAIRAANWAVDEAVSREVPLRLVEVIPQQAEPAPLAAVGNVRMELEYGETALGIASAAVTASGQPVTVETAILRGDPATALIAESRDAEMVCVGSTGIGRFARALLGSTVAELAEAASCPLAIIRTQHSRPKPGSSLIVVAVSDSPGNDDVVEQAIREAQLRHAPVVRLGCGDKTSVTCPMTKWTGGYGSGSGAIPPCSSTPGLPELASPIFLM